MVDGEDICITQRWTIGTNVAKIRHPERNERMSKILYI